MTVTETAVDLPDGRTIYPGQSFRIKGERGVYRARERCGNGLWAYGGDLNPEGRRQWRCIPLDKVGAFYKPGKGCRV